jgi:hypothetical protein
LRNKYANWKKEDCISEIKYIADIISPNNSFNSNLHILLSERHKLLTLKEMGFPENWGEMRLWN